jgi:hypothetical protein
MDADWRNLIATDSKGRLVEDVPCRRCGYSLRQQTLNGPCPECATPVSLTLHPALLRFAEPKWVRRLARGATLLCLAAVAAIPLQVGVQFVTTVLPLTNPVANDMVVAALWGFSTIAVIIEFAGIWMLTTREPGACGWSRTGILRWLLRNTFAAAACMTLVWQAFDLCPLLSTVRSNYKGHLDVFANAVLHVALALQIAGTFLLYLVLRNIADCTPDDGLRRRTTIVMMGLIILSGVFLMYSLMMEAGALKVPQIHDMLAMIFNVPGLVLEVWMIVLLFQYRRRLKRAAEIARISRDRLQRDHAI